MVTFKTISEILDDFDNLKSNNKHIFIRGVGSSFMQTILETTSPKCEKDTYIADMKTVKLSTDAVTVKTLVKILTKTQALNSKFAFQTKEGECLYVYDITPGVGDVIELHVGSYLYDMNGNKVTTAYKDCNNEYVVVNDDNIHTIEKDIALIEYLAGDDFAGDTLVNVKKYLMDIRTPQHLYNIVKQRPELIKYMRCGKCYDEAILTIPELDELIIEDNELFILLRDKYSYVSQNQTNVINNLYDYSPRVVMDLISNIVYLKSILTHCNLSDLVSFLIDDQEGAYISQHKKILVCNLIKAIKTIIEKDDDIYVKTMLRDFINYNLPHDMLIDLKYSIEKSSELCDKVKYLNISF